MELSSQIGIKTVTLAWLTTMASLGGQLYFRLMQLEGMEGSRMSGVLFSNCSLTS